MIIFRKKTLLFHSIENVFNALQLFLDVKVCELPYESNGLINRLRNIIFLKKSKSNFYHITGNDHYLLWWPFKNVILTVHDIEALKRKTGFKRWLFKKLWFEIPIKNATIVTTISEFSKKEILSLLNNSTPITVIYNPLTLPIVFSPYKFNKEETRILHLGTKENKNLLRTVKALIGLNCHLTIIGNPDSKIITALHKYSIIHTIKCNLNNQEIISEYINCDIVSFVSTYEGFGLPIIEAQAVGRPIITSNISSMPEVAGNGAIFVNPYSIVEIKNAFLRIIQNPKLRENIIHEGVLNVRRFDPEEIARQYRIMYEKVDYE